MKKSKIKKRYFVIAILLILAVGFLIWNFSKEEKTSGVWNPVEINSENLPSNLEKLNIIEDLPEDGLIALKIGNNEYAIQKGNVNEGLPQNPDLSITLPENYFEIFGQHGWCSGLQIATRNGDIGIQMHDSETALAWKYKSMFKYKNCLG